MKDYKNNNQKGFALYLIVIMMSVLLAAVLGLSNIIIGGVNLAIIVRDSGNAFYAADSGVEKALYLIANNPDYCENFSGQIGDSEYNGSYDVRITCETEKTTIISTGSYGDARKRIEVYFPVND